MCFAFGCPAMGDEELDPDFEELFNDCAGKLVRITALLVLTTGEPATDGDWEAEC